MYNNVCIYTQFCTIGNNYLLNNLQNKNYFHNEFIVII